MRAFALLFIALVPVPALAGDAPPAPSTEIGQVLAHPLFEQMYVCSEHAAGQLPHPGDDLGQDCMIMSFDEGDTAVFYKLYRTDGASNEDWYGWNRPVRSPCDCEVVQVAGNDVTNLPGKPHKSRAAGLVLESSDGTMFALGHLQGIVVAEGATLKRGDRVGFVGNNGYARAPHVHIGAWRGDQALQIRWDQRAILVE
jgi:hypothetical protein